MIEIKNLHKSFDNHKVLDGLNLSVRKGETVVIIGRSGCGKSVLLKHIIGVMKPDKGQITVDGEEIAKLSGAALNKVRLKIGMLFQGAALFDSLTVGENVGFLLRRHTKLSSDEIKKRVKEALRVVGLRDIENLTPSALSGGMRKRVGLARAICSDNLKIILYDEPTTGVDPIMGDAINSLINSLHDKLNVTSIAVTHDMNSAYKIADRIAMLYKGKIIAVESVDEIKNSKNPFIRQFVRGQSAGPIT
jgi:phospholipid/cholesterol/gamma-HCH transport system ATP-binding protein